MGYTAFAGALHVFTLDNLRWHDTIFPVDEMVQETG
jgi:hypothetical protein